MTKNWNNLREVTGTLVSELAGRDIIQKMRNLKICIKKKKKQIERVNNSRMREKEGVRKRGRERRIWERGTKGK